MKTIEEWLEESPAPVVGRIITSPDDARMIAISAAGTPMENAMAEVLEGAKRTEREAYARVQAISAESRSLFNHYSNKLK